ncbi:unnamed protein product, partial [Meganyctiphanes norvegica]
RSNLSRPPQLNSRVLPVELLFLVGVVMARITFNIRSLVTITGALKCVEILLAIICIALLRHYNLHFGQESWTNAQSLIDRKLVGIIAIGSSLLISLPLLVGYVFFEHSENLLEILYCITAASMNIAGGSLAVETYKDSNHDAANAGLAMGALMIINALMYLIDACTGAKNSK